MNRKNVYKKTKQMVMLPSHFLQPKLKMLEINYCKYLDV